MEVKKCPNGDAGRGDTEKRAIVKQRAYFSMT
jgi:hypothetical protein